MYILLISTTATSSASAHCGVDILLTFHSCQHNFVMGLDGRHILILAGKGCLWIADGLHSLAQAILRHERDDLAGMFLLGVDPARDLIDVFAQSYLRRARLFEPWLS